MRHLPTDIIDLSSANCADSGLARKAERIYFLRMKRFYCVCLMTALAATPALRAQDGGGNSAAADAARAEAQENYNTLKGHMDDMLAAQADQAKQILGLKREIEDLQQQATKPTGNYASAEDLKQLAQAVQDLDKKREADKQLILQEVEKLGKVVSAPVGHVTEVSAPDSPPSRPPADQNGFYYKIKKDDTLSTVAQAYREQEGLKVSVKEIQDANPNVNPNKLQVGMKIFIPAPKGFVPKPAPSH
jgi:LysM repeat protein